MSDPSRVPAGVPAASSPQTHSPSPGAASRTASAAKVAASGASSVHPSSPRPRPRLTAAQLDETSRGLSAEGRAVLVFLSEVRVASGAQLARRWWGARVPSDARSRLARKTLARLEASGLVDRLPQRIGGVRGGSRSIIYALGATGRRLLKRDGITTKRVGAPGERYLAHHLDATELRVRLFEAGLRGELDVIEIESEPRCWRTYTGPHGASRVVKPDLFVRIGAGALEDRYLVEIDRATESLPTITAKARVYLEHYRSGSEQHQHGVYPRVIWTAPADRRAAQLHQALASLPSPARRLFSIWPYDELVGRMAAEARA